MTILMDKDGNAHHQHSVMLNSAGYVNDPISVLAALQGPREPWWYTLPANPANYKPPVFEGYPNVHTLYHEPWK